MERKIIEMSIVDEDSLVVQANSLIMAQYSLTVQEKRLVLYLISQIRRDAIDFNIYRVNFTEFQKIIGVSSSKNHEALQMVTQRLLDRKSFIIEESDGPLQVGWLASAKYYSGYVEIEISKKLRPYLLNLRKVFTQFQLKNAIKLKSYYSIRIYELLKQYENIGERTLSVAKLRVILGIESDNYANYANFKQKVLLVAQRELTKKSDITFDIFEKKEKRKVEQIKFIIKQNSLEEKITTLDINKELFERLQKYFCLPEKQAEEVLKKYDEVYIHRVLMYVEHEIKKGTVKNIGAYTIKAIKDNYHEQKSLFDQEKKEKKNEQKLLELHKQDEERLKEDYERYKKQLAQKYIKTLNEKELTELETNAIILAKNQFAFMLKGKKDKDIDRNNYFVMITMESEVLKDKRILSINDFLRLNKENYQSLIVQEI